MKLFKNIIDKFNQDTSIMHKFIIFSVTLIVVPVFMMSIIFFNRFHQILRDEVGASYELVASQYADGIENKLITYQNLLSTIGSNGIVQDIFQHQDKYRKKDTIDMWHRFSKEIDNQIYAKNTNEIQSIVLFARNSEFPRDGIHLSNYAQVESEDWFATVFDQVGAFSYFHYTTLVFNTDLISIVRNIPNLGEGAYTEELGLIRIELLSKEFFTLQGEGSKKHAYDLYVLDEKNELIYMSSKTPVNEVSLKEALLQSGNNIASDRFKGYITVGKQIKSSNWSVIMLFSDKELGQKVRATGLYIFVVMFIMLIVLVGLMILFTTTFSKRAKRLANKIKNIEEGDLQITEIVEGKDEIGTIDSSFNHLILRLGEQIKQNYIQRIETREAELRAMQFQINPHFLYNTLEAISGMAAVNGTPDISNVCERLGMMFRYSINKGGSLLVELKDEIQHLENYFYIQNLRFSNSITVVIDIPETLMYCKIPKFILQPLVENIIIHGFENQNKKGFIELSARVEGPNLYIDLYDDGKGMSEQQVEDLNIYINKIDNINLEEKNRSIGIRNVNIRIKLIFGEQYGLQISSILNKGTQVRIILPLGSIKKENE